MGRELLFDIYKFLTLKKSENLWSDFLVVIKVIFSFFAKKKNTKTAYMYVIMCDYEF